MVRNLFLMMWTKLLYFLKLRSVRDNKNVVSTIDFSRYGSFITKYWIYIKNVINFFNRKKFRLTWVFHEKILMIVTCIDRYEEYPSL